MGLAFWRRAEADPDWTALVEPDGTQRTAGELLARVNQLTHALRALGLRPGDGIAVLLPNGGRLPDIPGQQRVRLPDPNITGAPVHR